eukprot:g18739.t1
MGISPIAFVFALPWLSVEIGHQSLLLEKGKEAETCSEGERRERLREGLRGVGLTGEGNPCEWTGIECIDGCSVRRIESREASGNVASFGNMTSLEDLSLSHLNVSGDLSSLQHLTSLKWLYLSQTQVSGDLSSLRNLTRLSWLDLSQTQVFGDISSLQHLTSLKSLYLSQTQVFGDISSLQNLTSLKALDLSHTQVSGDISSLQNLTSLWRLDLSHTQVCADLSSLQHLTSLEALDLSRIQLSGDISSLQNLTSLEALDLSHTQVSGDLSHLRKLSELRLAQTPVQGDVAALEHLPELKLADLSGTLVFGFLEGSCKKDYCQKLRELNVADTKVAIGNPSLMFPSRGWPALQTLNVSGSQLNITTGELLDSLMYTRITRLIAANCALNGKVPLPWSRTLDASLHVLDLSHNRLDAVIADSWLPKIRLDLSHNAHPLRVSAEVIRRAIKSGMELRLCIMLGSAIALTLLAAAAWHMRHRVPSLSQSNKCLLQLLLEQLAALLQLTQLWAVLGRLRRPISSGTQTEEQSSSDLVLSLLEVLQFTSTEDGVAVRSLFALATPLVPLLILLLCSCAEIFSRGLGICVGLKILTVLFIGGASGSAQLLGCQEVDGAGVPLKHFAFRPLFPQQRCSEAPWVDRIGWTTAFCYGVLIPCFLGFLFAKQNVVMRRVKAAMVESLVFGSDTEELEALQWHFMAQMLMERSILEQKEDRVMLGAKQLFCKYAKCENVWMEVCIKVMAAALVSVVAVNNLWLSVAITLGMALVIGLTRPFVQPQLNVLQTACFACLAVAAVGFRHHVALARLALAVPFGLLLVQLRHPDSPEIGK